MPTIGEIYAEQGALRGLWTIFFSGSILRQIVMVLFIGALLFTIFLTIKLIIHFKHKSKTQYRLFFTKKKLVPDMRYLGDFDQDKDKDSKDKKIGGRSPGAKDIKFVFFGLSCRADLFGVLVIMTSALYYLDPAVRVYIELSVMTLIFVVYVAFWVDYMTLLDGEGLLKRSKSKEV